MRRRSSFALKFFGLPRLSTWKLSKKKFKMAQRVNLYKERIRDVQ